MVRLHVNLPNPLGLYTAVYKGILTQVIEVNAQSDTPKSVMGRVCLQDVQVLRKIFPVF